MSHHSQNKAIQLLQEFSIPLIAGVVFAVIWANIAPHSYHDVMHWSPWDDGHGHFSKYNFHFLMNDLFMAIFFGLAAKEITESLLPGGSLNPMKKAINPLLGTLGGVLGPVGVYFTWVAMTGDSSIANGWGIPTATDIALAWLVARLIFGKGHPAVSFLLLLAVADDGIGLGIIAIFYPNPDHPVNPVWLALTAVAMAGAYGLRKKDVQSYWPYLIGPGVLSWCGLYFAHLHPALALVPVIPFLPAATHDDGIFVQDDTDHHTDTLNRFEHEFKLPVDLGLFGFGLANAGVELSSMGNATFAVLAGLAIGKTVGIFGFSMVGVALGFPLPKGMGWRSLLTAGLVAGIGLTVALFVSGVAFTDGTLQGAAKMGALLSAFLAPIAILMGKLLRVRDEYEATQDMTATETRIIELDEDDVQPEEAEYGSELDEDEESDSEYDPDSAPMH